jgi:sigma-E factor negative regulatory protein RseB
VRPFVLLLLGLFGLGGQLASAETNDSRALYARIQQALMSVDYRATLVFTQGSAMSTYRVLHRVREGQIEEYLLSMDGERREFYRQGREVFCLLPGRPPMTLSATGTLPGSGEGLVDVGADLDSHYALQAAGEERLAGRLTGKYMVMARDRWRYSYLLWLDTDTGIVLKSATTAPDGRLLEKMQMTHIEFQPQFSEPEFLSEETWRKALAGAKPAELQREMPPGVGSDWSPGWLPEGFYAQVGGADMRRFTDGLASFSVFVEAGEDMPEGSSRQGATTAVTRHLGHSSEGSRSSITVVGEIPLETALKVADNIVF